MSNSELIIPNISNTIINIIKGDYPEIKELLEYKRDATLVLLKASGAMAVYTGKVELKVKKDVKDWDEFVKFAEDYSVYIVQEATRKYKNEEAHLDDAKKKYSNLEMKNLKPAIITIANEITRQYLKRFPSWPSSGTQEDYITIDLKSSLTSGDLIIYWSCIGEIFVKDTKFDYPINGNLYSAEFSGQPEFLYSIFDMEVMRQFNEMAKKDIKKLKSRIDEMDEKIITQKMDKLLLSFDI